MGSRAATRGWVSPPHPVVHPPNPNPVRHLLIQPIERLANSIHTVPSAPSHALASTTWRSRAQTQSVSACECVCVCARACGRFAGLNTGETRRRIPSSPPGAIAPPHDDSPFTIHHAPSTGSGTGTATWPRPSHAADDPAGPSVTGSHGGSSDARAPASWRARRGDAASSPPRRTRRAFEEEEDFGGAPCVPDIGGLPQVSAVFVDICSSLLRQ